MRATHHPSIPACHQTRNQQDGFTLPEVLLSGALAALLLTALAHATVEFGYTLSHLEQKAGISNAQDSVLRRLTRDIRESWWADLVNDTHLRLADTDGAFTEYFLSGNDLMLRRPNGDEGVIFPDVAHLKFEATSAPRKREGTATNLNTAWYVQPDPGTFPLPLESPQGGSIALSFDPPLDAVSVGGAAGEELSSASIDTISLPLAFVAAPGGDPGSLAVSVFATRGPGVPHPMGTALASLSVPGSSLPAAVASGSSWEIPVSETSLSLSPAESLEPAAGYAVVLSASAGASFVVSASPVVPDPSLDLIATQDATPGSNWVELPMLVPFSITGPTSLTSTLSQDMVVTLSVTLQQSNRPSQTRSATVLSQTLGESPWLGVVPGETAP